jgi:hypothetical protein
VENWKPQETDVLMSLVNFASNEEGKVDWEWVEKDERRKFLSRFSLVQLKERLKNVRNAERRGRRSI